MKDATGGLDVSMKTIRDTLSSHYIAASSVFGGCLVRTFSDLVFHLEVITGLREPPASLPRLNKKNPGTTALAQQICRYPESKRIKGLLLSCRGEFKSFGTVNRKSYRHTHTLKILRTDSIAVCHNLGTHIPEGACTGSKCPGGLVEGKEAKSVQNLKVQLRHARPTK